MYIKLFHITPKVNLENILKHGLIPNYRKGMCSYITDKKPVIWLTNNVRYIIRKQVGWKWVREFEPVVLTINVTDIIDSIRARIVYPSEIPTVCPHEFLIEQVIDPKHIISYKVFSYEDFPPNGAHR